MGELEYCGSMLSPLRKATEDTIEPLQKETEHIIIEEGMGTDMR